MDTSRALADLVADPDRLQEIPEEDLPDLLGALERLRARVWCRLVRPSRAGAQDLGATPEENGDRLLDVDQVAEILGVETRYVYDHADDWPFTRRLSTRKLRFSERALYRWLSTRR